MHVGNSCQQTFISSSPFLSAFCSTISYSNDFVYLFIGFNSEMSGRTETCQYVISFGNCDFTYSQDSHCKSRIFIYHSESPLVTKALMQAEQTRQCARLSAYNVSSIYRFLTSQRLCYVVVWILSIVLWVSRKLKQL